MHRDSASIRALLIDALGTLVALAPPAPVLASVLASRFGVTVSPREAADALAAEIAFYRAHMDEGRDTISLAALRARCAEVLRAALPASDRLRGVATAQLTSALLDSLRFAPFADARDALVAARGRGARVVVVSNWDVSLIEVLERIGLAPLVDGVVTSAAVGARKPAAAIFEHALAIAGARPAGALHVGDSLAEDIAGARACGVEAILLRRDAGPAAAGAGLPPADGVPVIATLAALRWP
ncbi:MAG: HAD-IA family hydrolase [Solirubrobacteraceae bacterium]|jgi:putative hydrolase of the HAD superfamily